MNNKKLSIAKSHFITKMKLDGLSSKESEIAYASMISLMTESLINGRRINFKNVGTLDPEIREPSKVSIYGKDVDAGYRIKVTFENSRTLDRMIKSKNDPEQETNREMEKLLKRKNKKK